MSVAFAFIREAQYESVFAGLEVGCEDHCARIVQAFAEAVVEIDGLGRLVVDAGEGDAGVGARGDLCANCCAFEIEC